jgi:UDP-N-acetylglucosamine 4,6-dehydratase
VLVSTDKACEPENVYGRTKALAEDIFRTAYAYAPHGPVFSIVRYGNVAGSTGSVIPIWRQAMAEGRSCEIRDPDATRFWMSCQQAVDFVLEAVSQGKPGELRVPTLPAYRLGDLAAAMGVREYECTALGSGEKMHESMLPGQPSNVARRMTINEIKEALKNV